MGDFVWGETVSRGMQTAGDKAEDQAKSSFGKGCPKGYDILKANAGDKIAMGAAITGIAASAQAIVVGGTTAGLATGGTEGAKAGLYGTQALTKKAELIGRDKCLPPCKSGYSRDKLNRLKCVENCPSGSKPFGLIFECNKKLKDKAVWIQKKACPSGYSDSKNITRLEKYRCDKKCPSGYTSSKIEVGQKRACIKVDSGYKLGGLLYKDKYQYKSETKWKALKWFNKCASGYEKKGLICRKKCPSGTKRKGIPYETRCAKSVKKEVSSRKGLECKSGDQYVKAGAISGCYPSPPSGWKMYVEAGGLGGIHHVEKPGKDFKQFGALGMYTQVYKRDTYNLDKDKLRPQKCSGKKPIMHDGLCYDGVRGWAQKSIKSCPTGETVDPDEFGDVHKKRGGCKPIMM